MGTLKGFKTYRHDSNPKEKELHDKFIEQHIDNEAWTCPVDLLVFPACNNTAMMPSDYLSDREKQIMISTIQWLGSPVGQSFMRECGFTLNK